jgi:hypothetical protein
MPKPTVSAPFGIVNNPLLNIGRHSPPGGPKRFIVQFTVPRTKFKVYFNSYADMRHRHGVHRAIVMTPWLHTAPSLTLADAYEVRSHFEWGINDGWYPWHWYSQIITRRGTVYE